MWKILQHRLYISGKILNESQKIFMDELMEEPKKESLEKFLEIHDRISAPGGALMVSS